MSDVKKRKKYLKEKSIQKKIKASVIVPIYNTEFYISKCLNSIINQTEKNIEIICINDGSNDKSSKILNIFKNKDKRIKIVNQKHRGVAAARNVGLKIAVGEYIFFVDSDDTIEKNTITYVYNQLEYYKADIAIFGIKIKNNEQKYKNWIENKNPKETKAVIKKSPTFIFKEKYVTPFVWRNVYNRIFLINNNLTFDENFIIGEDLLFCLTSILKANKIITIKNKFYNYTINRYGSQMYKLNQNLILKIKEHLRIAEKLNTIFKEYKKNKYFNYYFLKYIFFFIYNEFKKMKLKEKEYINNQILKIFKIIFSS